ncbi:hypothetical protein [Pantoea agglomerans]|uniref:Uncharacterized protein n=1 Tax=Enterobacter agglomerans TaxID=549 RepID=A0ACC5RTI4_ENTAG|nr:hypothetical protein [Pantoea agglomerans]MBK4727970.1 hypothetical protein [Pantoea agglomerans]
MSAHKWISDFFVVFFGQDSDEYGNTYPEIVDTAFKTISRHGMQHIDDLINGIDLFRETYTDNESAASALNTLTHGLAGDTHYYTPTLLDFLAWLSATLKQKRKEDRAK